MVRDVEGCAREVWEELRDEFGEALRGAGCFAAIDHEIVMRDDVGAAYTVEERRTLVDNAIVHQLQLREQVHNGHAGDVEAVINYYDDAYVIHYPETLRGKDGYVVSIERHRDERNRSLVDTCISYLRERTSAARSE